MRLAQLCFAGRATVPGESGLSSSGDGGNDSGRVIDLADNIVFHLDEVDIAGVIEAHFVWIAELRGSCRPSVTGIAACSVAGDDRHFSIGADLADKLRVTVADVERVIGTARDSVGAVEFGLAREFGKERDDPVTVCRIRGCREYQREKTADQRASCWNHASILITSWRPATCQ